MHHPQAAQLGIFNGKSEALRLHKRPELEDPPLTDREKKEKRENAQKPGAFETMRRFSLLDKTAALPLALILNNKKDFRL